MNTNLYPLKFIPIYKSKIWGGKEIAFYKGIDIEASDIGESWEISPMAGDVSIVKEGPLRGQTLNSLVKEYAENLLGQHVYDDFGGEFPLLIKMIDANDTLSVQVHPGDEYAKKHHNSRGKTEMWYLLLTKPDATIYAGWKKETSCQEVKDLVRSGAVVEYLEQHHAEKGDTFFLPAGKVHTIGKGCLILEIQQASDITYRMYDFGRVDDQGKERELHIDQAAEVLDYRLNAYGAEPYEKGKMDELVPLVTCQYFRTSYMELSKSFELPVQERDSFTVLYAIEGKVLIETEHDQVYMEKGETLLIPALLSSCRITPQGACARLLDSFVPKRRS